MRHDIPRFSTLAVSLGVTGLFSIGYPAEVRAQTVFCPPTFRRGGHPLLWQTGRAPMARTARFRAPRWLVRRSANYLRRRPK